MGYWAVELVIRNPRRGDFHYHSWLTGGDYLIHLQKQRVHFTSLHRHGLACAPYLAGINAVGKRHQQVAMTH